MKQKPRGKPVAAAAVRALAGVAVEAAEKEEVVKRRGVEMITMTILMRSLIRRRGKVEVEVMKVLDEGWDRDRDGVIETATMTAMAMVLVTTIWKQEKKRRIKNRNTNRRSKRN
jgi:hypothetical protein